MEKMSRYTQRLGAAGWDAIESRVKSGIGFGRGVWLTAALSAVAFLGACNGVKNTVIPSDPNKWDQIIDSVKSLNDDDRKLFSSYMGRMALGTALSGSHVTIPPGTTIGDAIKQQSEWEAKQKDEQAQAEAVKAKLEAVRAVEAAKINAAATVVVTNATVIPEDITAGRYDPRFAMTIGIQNKSNKQISGIKGTLDFQDQFGSEITKVGLSLDEDVSAGQLRTVYDYGKDLNQFNDVDKKLATTPFNKMHIAFTPDVIVFADGTKIGSPPNEK